MKIILMKKILLIVATHGDEKIGLAVIEKLKEKGYSDYFDSLVANPKALKTGKRFVDCDLNRSYPGKKYSKFYKKRQAYKNLQIAKKYKYVLDIHEASHGTDNFIIIPRDKIPKEAPVDFVNLDKIVLWPVTKGSTGSTLPSLLGLEFGMKNKNRHIVERRALDMVKEFTKRAHGLSERKPLKNKAVYQVYGKIDLNDKTKNLKLADFRKAKFEEEFFPLLVGQYKKQGILCYKMKKQI